MPSRARLSGLIGALWAHEEMRQTRVMRRLLEECDVSD